MAINMQQLPVKAHYFFFMAAMGPILPFLFVYGKQLGISADIMGYITAVLPILYLISKPIFGFIMDFFRNHRKILFICLVIGSSLSFVLLYFLPQSSESLQISNTKDSSDKNCQNNSTQVEADGETGLYTTPTFWIFVILMAVGSIGFNVTNSMSDAICFDVLGEGGSMGYGRQRVWGTIGFGIAALFAGYLMDFVSKDLSSNSYTPAFILIIVFTSLDAICCTKLKLPAISNSNSNITKDVFNLLKRKIILIFLVFTVIVGILDSFIIYFLFWYVEDLACVTNHMERIKLIEGLIVAAETLGGEVIFFSFSGKILKKFGYGYSMTFCFLCYALRFGLISLAPNPWYIIFIELISQGPTYALCYTIIVGFASVIAPPGSSATVQGIFAGMDDGLGFAVGSVIGGLLFKNLGGLKTLRIFSSLAGVTGVIFFIVYLTILKPKMPETKNDAKNEKELDNIVYKNPKDALNTCHQSP